MKIFWLSVLVVYNIAWGWNAVHAHDIPPFPICHTQQLKNPPKCSWSQSRGWTCNGVDWSDPPRGYEHHCHKINAMSKEDFDNWTHCLATAAPDAHEISRKKYCWGTVASNIERDYRKAKSAKVTAKMQEEAAQARQKRIEATAEMVAKQREQADRVQRWRKSETYRMNKADCLDGVVAKYSVTVIVHAYDMVEEDMKISCAYVENPPVNYK